MLTIDEWIFFGILVAIIFGVGGVPRLAKRFFGASAPGVATGDAPDRES